MCSFTKKHRYDNIRTWHSSHSIPCLFCEWSPPDLGSSTQNKHYYISKIVQNQNELRIHKCVPTSSSVFHWFIMSLSIYHNQWRQFLTVCLASSNWWWTSASSASNFRRIFSKSWQAWHDINISNQILESRHFQLSVESNPRLRWFCQSIYSAYALRTCFYTVNLWVTPYCYAIVIILLIGQTPREMKFLDGISITETFTLTTKKNQYQLWTNSLPTFSEFRNRSSRSAMRASCLAFCLAKPLAFSSSSARAWFVSCSLSSKDFLSFVNCWNKSIPCQYRLNTRVSPVRDKV